jgi:hypothetical protein
MVAQLLKWAGKRTWRPERVVRATGGGGPAVAGVESAAGLKVMVAVPQPVSFSMQAGLTLSVDTVMGLSRMRICIVFSLRDRTW